MVELSEALNEELTALVVAKEAELRRGSKDLEDSESADSYNCPDNCLNITVDPEAASLPSYEEAVNNM